MRIFVSYSSKNRPAIQSLVEDLEGLDHDVWFDQELAGGQKWWDTILENIRACDVFVLAMTPEWAASRACELESDYAIRLQKICIPLLLDNVNVEALRSAIQQLQIVDYRSQDKEAYRRLIRALQTLPSSPPLPEPLPPPPSMPLSPLAEIADELKANPLLPNRQEVLLIRLRELLVTESDAARDLLRQLYKHPSAIPPIIESIRSLLGEETHTPKPKSEASKAIQLQEVAFERVWFNSDHSYPSGDVTGIAFLRNGKQFVTLSSCDRDKMQPTGLVLWDAIYFQAIKCVELPIFREDIDAYLIGEKYVLFSQDDEHHVMAFLDPNRPVTRLEGAAEVGVKLWDFDNRLIGLQLGPPPDVYTVAADSKHFAEVRYSYRTLSIYSMVSSGKLGGVFGSKPQLKLLETVELPPNRFHQMAFCGEANQYLICSTTGDTIFAGKLVIFDWKKKMIIRQWDKDQLPILKMALSPDRKWLAIATAKTLRVWDWQTQETVMLLDFEQARIIEERREPKQKVEFLFDLPQNLHPTVYDTCQVHSLAFSPDSKSIAFSTVFRPLEDEIIRDAPRREPNAPRDHNARAELGFRAKLWLWDFSSGRQPMLIETAYAPHKGLAFSPDGKHLVAGIKDHIKIWQIT